MMVYSNEIKKTKQGVKSKLFGQKTAKFRFL